MPKKGVKVIKTEQSKVLLKAVLEPVSLAVDKLRKDADSDEGAISIFRRKKNRLAVGIYDYGNLIVRMQQQKQIISYEINKMKDEYDSHYVVLSWRWS
jgi:hypothetical protein